MFVFFSSFYQEEFVSVLTSNLTWLCDLLGQLNVVEVEMYESWGLGLERPCSFKCYLLKMLPPLSEETQDALLNDERPHEESGLGDSQH